MVKCSEVLQCNAVLLVLYYRCVYGCMFCTLLFNSVGYDSYCYMYAVFCIFCFYRANWHSLATLTEVFACFFLGCKANARVNPAMTGHGPHSSKIFVLFYVLFVLCCSVYCLCVNVYCTTATGWLPNCS